MVDAFGAAHGTLDIYRPARIDDSVVISARVDPHDVSRFRTIEAVQLLWPLVGAIPHGVSMRAAVISDEDFARTEAYNEFIRPLGGIPFATPAQQQRRRGHAVEPLPPEGTENYGAEDAVALQMIAPHIQTAVMLQHRLRTLELRHAGLARLIDRLKSA